MTVQQLKMAECEESEVYMMHRSQRGSVNMSSISFSAICSLCLSHLHHSARNRQR